MRTWQFGPRHRLRPPLAGWPAGHDWPFACGLADANQGPAAAQCGGAVSIVGPSVVSLAEVPPPDGAVANHVIDIRTLGPESVSGTANANQGKRDEGEDQGGRKMRLS